MVAGTTRRSRLDAIWSVIRSYTSRTGEEGTEEGELSIV